MAGVRFEAVSRRWPDGGFGVRDLDLEIADGELLVLVGPSGSGKSTALRLAAGLDRPTAGRVWIGGRDVTRLGPRDRDVAMVFQSYALYPHKSVRANLAFPLRMKRLPRAEIRRRVEETAALLDIADLLERRPAQLSGGQRQRVALGRAIVRRPAAFLLDEPLSNLDVGLRARTRAELARLHRRLGATVLYVTHDQEEAMTLGDRVAVLRDGRLEQVDAPLALYRRPATVFVARFIGSPPMNVLDGVVADGRLRGPDLTLDPPPDCALPASGARVRIGVRPSDVEAVAPGAPTADLTRPVDVVEPLGAQTIVHLAGEPPLVAVLPGDAPVSVGDPLGLRLPPDHLHVFGPDGRRLPPL